MMFTYANIFHWYLMLNSKRVDPKRRKAVEDIAAIIIPENSQTGTSK
jgi:hypothetical protein